MEDLFVNDSTVPGEDPVVTEMPIYLNTERQPFVLQYPTRKLDERSIEQTASTVRLKSKTSMLQVDITSDMPYNLTDSDRKHRWNDLSYQSFGGMLKPSGDRYAVGQIVDNELILTRVQKTAQLRPSFDHFNQQAKDERERLQVKDDRPAVIRSVQVSAKSSNEAVSRYSEVIDFYKNVSQEEQTIYGVAEPTRKQTSALARFEPESEPEQSLQEQVPREQTSHDQIPAAQPQPVAQTAETAEIKPKEEPDIKPKEEDIEVNVSMDQTE